MPLRTKIFIYKSYIKPITLYAAPVWAANISNSSWNKLKRLQTSTLRMVTGSQWFVSNLTVKNSSGLTTIGETVKEDLNRYKERLRKSEYENLRAILDEDQTEERVRKRPLNLASMV